MTDTSTPPKPTAAELELLRLLWQIGPSSAKALHQAAVQARPDISDATVLRLLQMMHAKGLLTRDERSRAHVYAPAQAQEALQTNLLKDLIHKAFSGSGKELILAALRGHVSATERAEIQAFLDKPD